MITIITPCSRPHNLELLRLSLIDTAIRQEQWLICHDATFAERESVPGCGRMQYFTKGGVSGNAQRNRCLSEIKDPNQWVYCLDDDNIMHTDFIRLAYDLFHCYKRYSIITFDQLLEDGTIRKGNDPRVGYIDQAQFLIRRSIHEEYEQDYNADGIMISNLIAKYPDRWLYIPETLSYYNRLQWKK